MDFSVNWLSLGPALVVMFSLLGLDILGGFLVAMRNKEVSSSTSYPGLLKKVGIFVYIGVGMCFDLLMVNYQDQIGLADFRPPLTAATIITFFYIYHETLSITEKIDRLGLPMPPFVKSMLSRLKRVGDGGGITFPQVKIGHVSAHDVKVDSDLVDEPIVEKVAARRTERKVDKVLEQTVENSAILKTVKDAVAPTATPNNETTVHE